MKRFISIVLFASLLFTCIVPLSASEITPYYNGVVSGAAMLNISTFGIATCTTTFTLRYSLVEAARSLGKCSFRPVASNSSRPVGVVRGCSLGFS